MSGQGRFPDSLRRIAEEQKGHVTRRQTLAAGFSAKQTRRRMERGEFRPLRRGVYRLVGVPPSWEAEVAAARNSAGEHAVVSHGSAARLFQLGRARQVAAVELTVPYGRGSRTPGVLVHRSRRLDTTDVIGVAGFPVTSAVRTVIDLAARSRREQIIGLVDDVLGRGLATRSTLHRRAVELGRGRAGVSTIVQVTAPDAESGFRSWLERTGRRLLREHGIGGMEVNHPIHHAGQLIAILDLWWPAARLPLEWEGPRFHEPPAARRRDAKRSNALHRLGVHPLRFTYADLLEEPDRVVAEVRAALIAAGCGHLARP